MLQNTREPVGYRFVGCAVCFPWLSKVLLMRLRFTYARQDGHGVAGKSRHGQETGSAGEAALQQVGGRGSSNLRGGGVGLFTATERGV